MRGFFYKIYISMLRIIGYEKPYRVALLKLFSLKIKTFRPHYETIVYEASLEALRLGEKELTILELGVAGGNGIISLEKIKRRIEDLLPIKIKIYGFDSGEGLPKTKYA